MTETAPRGRSKTRSKAANEERERQVVEMWLAGYSGDETAEQLHISRATVQRIRKRVSDRRTAEWDSTKVDEARANEAAQITRLMRPYLLRGLQGDRRAAEFALKCNESRRKLLGLDAPTKVDATVRSELDSEIEQLIEQMRDAGPLPASEDREGSNA